MRLVEWLGLKQVGPRTVVCVPSKAIEAWLASGVLDDQHPLLDGLECNVGLERQLGALPLTQRIRKGQREYRQRESAVTTAWDRIRQACTQAERFHLEARAAIAAAT